MYADTLQLEMNASCTVGSGELDAAGPRNVVENSSFLGADIDYSLEKRFKN